MQYQFPPPQPYHNTIIFFASIWRHVQYASAKYFFAPSKNMLIAYATLMVNPLIDLCVSNHVSS